MPTVTRGTLPGMRLTSRHAAHAEVRVTNIAAMKPLFPVLTVRMSATIRSGASFLDAISYGHIRLQPVRIQAWAPSDEKLVIFQPVLAPGTGIVGSSTGHPSRAGAAISVPRAPPPNSFVVDAFHRRSHRSRHAGLAVGWADDDTAAFAAGDHYTWWAKGWAKGPGSALLVGRHLRHPLRRVGDRPVRTSMADRTHLARAWRRRY